jgi:hypothetical protein
MTEGTWRDYKERKHFKPSPLKGIRVLEVCTLILGPSGPGFLATMGAEVIKCEIPPMGDTCRNMTPFGYLFRGYGPVFTHTNINKYWIGLDLHKAEGQEVFRELVAKSDVVEDNLRPGVMESWNVGYRQPRTALASGGSMLRRTGLPMMVLPRLFPGMPGCPASPASRRLRAAYISAMITVG